MQEYLIAKQTVEHILGIDWKNEEEKRQKEQDMENMELRRKINQAIGELPDKCREIFVLSYLKDMKNSEIALMMNVSVRTVEAHIYKALKSLRARLGIFFVFFVPFL